MPLDWSALYCRLTTACGWTPAAIDALPALDVWALLRWWRGHPPANEILLAVHRAPAAADKPADPADPSDIGALLARYPDGAVKSMT